MYQNLFQPPKFVLGTLTGADGNIYGVIGRFADLARVSGWQTAEIEQVRQHTLQSQSYHDALAVLSAHVAESALTPSIAKLNWQTLSLLKDDLLIQYRHLTGAKRMRKTPSDNLHGELVRALYFVIDTHLKSKRGIAEAFFMAFSPSTSAVGFLLDHCQHKTRYLIEHFTDAVSSSSASYELFLIQLVATVRDSIAQSENRPNQIDGLSYVFDQWNYVECPECSNICKDDECEECEH